MKLLACYKLVAEEQDITITADRTLDTTRAGEKISPFDLNAIEEAVLLAGENDEVIALCVGGQALDNAKLRKDLLSRGPHGLYLVRDERLSTALAHETSRSLPQQRRKSVLICCCVAKALAISMHSKPGCVSGKCFICPPSMPSATLKSMTATLRSNAHWKMK